jgi:acetyl esterase/lipase
MEPGRPARGGERATLTICLVGTEPCMISPAPAPGAPLWRGMDLATLDAAYNNMAAVADSAQWIARWTARTREIRALHPEHLDLAYGDRPRNRIDLYRSGAREAPLLAFIHGGYWQRNSKEVFGCLAEGLLVHGIDVAMIGYTLCPEIRLSGIVDEIDRALAWLAERAPAHGFPARRIAVSGWSAGGHLTAMAMRHPAVAAGLAISGIFDLEPIRLGSLNQAVRLDPGEVERLSPTRQLPDHAGSLSIAYGEAELPELQRQSREFYTAWRAAGLPGQLAPIPGRDHFSILDELHRPDGALAAAVCRLVDRPAASGCP